MTKLVLTAIGDDRPGLVSALSAAVAGRGGNWLESQMAQLAGKFAGIVLVDVPSGAVDALRGDLDALGAGGLLAVAVTPAGDGEVGPSAPGDPGTPLMLHLIGHDQPGIVREVSEALATHDVTIDELRTSVSDAPMAGGLLFRADAIVRVPDSVGEDAVRAALEAIAAHLMVDLELREPRAADALS